jgi:lysophospholipase L1-like esterase
MRPTKRRLTMAAVVAAATAISVAPPATANGGGRDGSAITWRSGWATAPQQPKPGWPMPNWSEQGFAGESIRQVVRLSTGGTRLRIRLSNRYGATPLRVTGATVALTDTGAAVAPGTVRPLTFGRRSSSTVPAGTEITSDATVLRTSPLQSVTVTMYVAQPTGPATFHDTGLATTYRADGDRRFDRDGAAFAGRTSQSWYYLTAVEVAAPRHHRPGPGTVVAFGDSLTDGYGSVPDANNRYPDELAERLVAAGTPRAVANAGISGNKLLTDSPCAGEKGVSRFRWDVLRQPGTRTVILQLGGNDIGQSGGRDVGCGAPPVVAAEQVIEGHRTLIRIARAHGIRVTGATIGPMKGNSGYYSADKEAVRDAVNHWIRTGGEYDAVADFDLALRDPADPDALRPAYDSGDHLHPNDAGRAAMAAAIDPDEL